MIDVQTLAENIKETLKEAFTEHRTVTIAVSSALIGILLCLLIATGISDSKKKKQSKLLEQQKLILKQPLLIPKGPEIPDGYITARKTPKNWNTEEVEKWFTLPDQEELNKLSDSNTRIVETIIGAAP